MYAINKQVAWHAFASLHATYQILHAICVQPVAMHSELIHMQEATSTCQINSCANTISTIMDGDTSVE